METVTKNINSLEISTDSNISGSFEHLIANAQKEFNEGKSASNQNLKISEQINNNVQDDVDEIFKETDSASSKLANFFGKKETDFESVAFDSLQEANQSYVSATRIDGEVSSLKELFSRLDPNSEDFKTSVDALYNKTHLVTEFAKNNLNATKSANYKTEEMIDAASALYQETTDIKQAVEMIKEKIETKGNEKQ